MIMDKKDLSGFISRILVGGVFLYAGFLKISAPPEEFAYAIESYKIFSYKMSLILAYLVPWFEVYLGVFLLAGVYTVYCSIVSIIMFIIFEILLLQAIIRGLSITNCGCFGVSYSNSIYKEFLLNLLWLIFSTLSVFWGKFVSMDFYFEKKDRSLKTE